MVGSPRDLARVLREKWQVFRLYAGDQSLAVPLLRWGLWAIRCLLRWSAIVEIPGYDMRLVLLPRWKGCWKKIYAFRDRFFKISDPELDLVRMVLRPGDVFVDAGAYHGWYSLVASGAVGGTGLVLAFEPNLEAFAVLERNVALSGQRNIRIFHLALAKATSTVWLYKGPGDESPSALAYVPGGAGRELVLARRLDDVLAELQVSRVALMKLDVQGAEADLLEGAMRTLKQSRPALIFEVDPDAARRMGVSHQAAWGVLMGLGYQFFKFVDGTLVPLAVFPTVPEGTFCNIVAIPHGQERWALPNPVTRS
jgi:FkbM family methyltransferase